MIKVENLEHHFPIAHTVFENVSFEIKQGEFWGILGSNGSGKSTLVEVLLGMKKPQRGSISLFGKPAAQLLKNERHRISYISQDVQLKSNMTIGEFLTFHSHFYPNYSETFQNDLMEYFGLNLKTLIGSLSTGQRNKVQIVAAFSSNTELIVVDEVTAVLDPKSRHLFFNKLVEFNSQYGKTVILATNIVEDLIGRVEHILFINDGVCEVHRNATIEKLFE